MCRGISIEALQSGVWSSCRSEVRGRRCSLPWRTAFCGYVSCYVGVWWPSAAAFCQGRCIDHGVVYHEAPQSDEYGFHKPCPTVLKWGHSVCTEDDFIAPWTACEDAAILAFEVAKNQPFEGYRCISRAYPDDVAPPARSCLKPLEGFAPRAQRCVRFSFLTLCDFMCGMSIFHR